MSRYQSFALASLLVAAFAADGFAQHAPDVIERGKTATALVELSNAAGWTGTAFCVDKSGLFLTNARVVSKALDDSGTIHLVIDAGLETQRSPRARVLRYDDALDLALLQVDDRLTAKDLKQDAGTVVRALVKSKQEIVLTPLPLAHNAELTELADIATFGFPYPQSPAVGRSTYPAVTVLPGHISALRRENGRLLGIQIDSQLNPGASGAPVVDTAGRVIGVIAATVPGAAMNLAKPAYQLAEFLAAPGLVFDPSSLTEEDRARPVVWTVHVVPPTPATKLPENLTVSVQLASGVPEPRTFTAEPTGPGDFKVTLGPLRSVAQLGVELTVTMDSKHPPQKVKGKDHEVKIGAQTFKLSDIKEITGGSSPQVQTVAGQTVQGSVTGLGKARMKFGQMSVVDLSYASKISVVPFDLPGQDIVTLVEARQGSKVVATIRKRTKFVRTPVSAPAMPKATVRRTAPTPVITRVKPVGEGEIKLGAALNVDGAPRGAAKGLQPPRVAIPEAQLKPGGEKGPSASLVRPLEGTISDVVAGGGGRYLLVLLKAERKLAVFDLSAVEVVKTIPLSSSNALIAGGASKFLVAYPDEKRLERWDLATLAQEGDSHPLPFVGQLKQVVMGSDSNGPVLAFWFTGADRPTSITSQPRFSFIDLGTLTIQKIGSFTVGKYWLIREKDALSASGGSFMLAPFLGTQYPVALSASSGGGVFGVWELPSEFHTLTVHGSRVHSDTESMHVGHLAPGPDGRSMFTAIGRRRQLDEPIEVVLVPGTNLLPNVTIPSTDPTLYLSISGLPTDVAGTEPLGNRDSPASRPGTVTASVHTTSDGARLFTVYGLDEISVAAKKLDWLRDNLSTEKRFHLVPAAGLLITIPPQNDRLVLRRLNVDEALERSGTSPIFVDSPLTVTATAGRKLEHQISARSRKGGITYSLAKGPDGLSVADDGKLTWLVPKAAKDKELSVVVTVGDASGQEKFVTLKIHVK